MLNLIVTDHLVSTADARLSDRLDDAQHQTLSLPGPTADAERPDVDDAPLFLWSVAPSGVVTALTPTAPPLPFRHWGSAPVTLDVRGSNLRFDTLRTGDTVLVAGQSMAGTSNTQSTLLVAELVFGLILAVATFAGATVVGLRASAPSELVRRRQAEFTADASHELRTPISVIEAEVELALSRPRDPAAYRDVLERVGQERTRLRRIVEDLLWLARADNQTVQADASSVADVADVVEGCVQRFGALAATPSGRPFGTAGRQRAFHRAGGGGPHRSVGWRPHRQRLQVRRGSRPGWRRASAARAAGWTSVSTTPAPGSPTEQREAVFDRFHRATDSVAGTGLGLAIADSVVRSTQGSWEIGASDLGGARMEVSWRRALPRRGSPNPQNPDDPTTQRDQTLSRILSLNRRFFT